MDFLHYLKHSQSQTFSPVHWRFEIADANCNSKVFLFLQKIPWSFSEPSPPIKADAPMGHPPIKNEAPFQKMILRKKNSKNLELSLILVFHSKTTLEKEEIPQKRDFLTRSIQNFLRKVKQFVRKYYITWLIDLAN